MDVRNLQKIMKQMSTEELPAERVEIFLSGGKKLVIESPSAMRMQVMGQTTFQISGEAREEATSGEAPNTPQFSEEDVAIVAEKAGKGLEEAKRALEGANGDIAQAILSLSG